MLCKGKHCSARSRRPKQTTVVLLAQLRGQMLCLRSYRLLHGTIPNHTEILSITMLFRLEDAHWAL